MTAAGLRSILADTPVRDGYLDLGVSFTASRGPEGWAEVGLHPWENVAVFGRGFVNSADAGAMLGLRGTFGW